MANKILIIIVCFLIISCNKATEVTEQPNKYENNIKEDYELFENANQELQEKNYEEAISELDKISISIAMKEINLLEKLEINAVEEEIFSEFQVKTGELTLLSLSFTQDSWIEIYQGTKQLIYRLFKVDETLEISIKPPFKIIAGNANGVSGFYGESRINFTKVANKLNVSFIEIDNE